MFVLELERVLACDPERAFALISEPALMNRWSEARIERIAGGDGGHAGSIGALRRVWPRIAGRETALEEVIEASDPPHELVYRVCSSPTVRDHRGTIRIEPREGGSILRWRVEVDLAAAPMEWVARAAIGPSLERSLDALQRVAAEGVRAPVLPALQRWDEVAEARAIREQAGACLEAQRARADELLARGDDRGWFARTYSHVTDLQIEACDQGRFAHPAWVLRLVTTFHTLWDGNLRRRLGEPGSPVREVAQGVEPHLDVEPHWARAHRIAERRDGANTFVRCLRSVHAGVRAHIEDDLPRAIARVHLDHYAGRCDVARFRADYLRMGDIFERAGERVSDILPKNEWTLYTRVLAAITPPSLRAPVMDRVYYPITQKRREAFERAIGIVGFVAGDGISDRERRAGARRSA